MLPPVSTLGILIAIYNTKLNSKGPIASPYLKPLLTLNPEGKCLPILNLAYISSLKILHNLTFFWGGGGYFMHFTPYSLSPYNIISFMEINKQVMYI
jgi:hypothetical protein